MASRDDEDTRLNPGQTDADKKFGRFSDERPRANSASKRAKELLGKEDGAAKGNPSDSLTNRERSVIPDTNWQNKTEGKKQNVKFAQRLLKNRMLLAGGGTIGVGVIILLIIFTLLPLKLEMFLKNITQIASQVPAYATEQRLEYLVTRALAARMLGMANGVDGSLVFCKGGGVACSLFATYSSDYFENKLGIKIDGVSESGRVTLGGRATSWEVRPSIANGTAMTEAEIQKLTTTINSNAEMKALIRKEVAAKGAHYSVITRYLARKIMMKKYGVTNWRGPPIVEQADNKLTHAKANLEAGIIKNTVAKISPRMALYLTCLQGSTATCEKLRQGIDATKNSLPTADEPDPVKSPEERGLSPGDDGYESAKDAYDRDQAARTAVQEITDATRNLSEEAVEEGTKGIITKRVLALAGGGVALAGFLDIVFSAVAAVDNGALDAVWYDMASQTYTGFGSYVKTTSDKAVKAGELDSETLGAATALFDGAESSPLYQAEAGLSVDTGLASIFGGDVASAASGIVTMCNGANGEKVSTRLDPGELVCDDQKLVRDYTAAFKEKPSWNQLAAVSHTWVSSVGIVFEVANQAIGVMLSALGPAMDALAAVLQAPIEAAGAWIISLFAEPPTVGIDASGADNYVALSAYVRENQNALMMYGVDEDGTAMGGGGRVLTDEQVATIVSEQTQQRQDEYNSQSMIAKIFDVNLSGSFASRMVARMPSSLGSVFGLPMNSFSSIISGSFASAATTNQAVINPFNIPLYGYTSGELDSDPSLYTEQYCKQSALDREASYKLDMSISSIGVYTKSDPCALEKMVVGAALYDAGVYDNEHSFKRINNVD